MNPGTPTRVHRVRFALLGLLFGCLGFAPEPASADTVTLQNGAAIDGIVTGRHEGFVILSIGNVGTMKIPEAEVKKIEKNARTGYLDPDKGRKKKIEKIPEIKTAEAKGGADREVEKNGEPAEEAGGPDGADEADLDPEVEKRIRTLASDLTQQKTAKRTRAERQLAQLGDAALPELLKLTQHPFERTRIAVFRLLKKSSDFRVVDPALSGLQDDDKFVRKLAWETLRNVSGKSYSYPWDSQSRAKRERAVERWVEWAEQAKKERASGSERAPSTESSRNLGPG